MQELSLNNCRLDKRYDVSEQLGRGSYAEIYLARDILASTHSPHSQVVIKALNVFLQNDLDADLERTLVENFQNEAIALDRVRHPNIISRIGHGTARDLKGTVFHYLVIEYLSGGDLQGLLRKQEIRLPQALSYIEQICAGLGHAHARGIIHRDIKPQNILLTADLKTVKIADFGVARVSAADSPITRVGTNIYAPPEHSPMSAGRTGELSDHRLTPSADIYSLAKTIYTLLTREAPRQYANAQINSIPSELNDQDWASELIRVLKRATTDKPENRHQTVEEFWSDLSGIRSIAAEGDYSTTTSSEVALPQPHVSRGYSPIAPALPSFEAIAETPSTLSRSSENLVSSQESVRPSPSDRDNGSVISIDIGNHRVPSSKTRLPVRRFAAFVIAVGLFTGILYGTANYMRGRGMLPGISNPFNRVETAVANTDIYLRPGPNTDNEPIGLVTKNSKVRIVTSQNNWYQVDVVQQGRNRPSQVNATRGWLNGRYLDLNEN